jgi:hypothetical protein
MGGIPFYLKQVDTSMSAAQNINNLCFQPGGILYDEFDALYRSLFNKSEHHMAIIEVLSKKARGLTRDELIASSKTSTGGSTTRILSELEESNFIRKYNSYGKKGKGSLFQLTDFYSLFYLKFIKSKDVLDENHWMAGLNTPKQHAWAGYAFEQVCLAHLPQIKKGLGISGIQSAASSWIGGSGPRGAQIDLVLDRSDRVINLFEMKFSIDTFAIDKKCADDLRKKISVFREVTKTRKAIFLTMITTFGLKMNTHAMSTVQNELTMEDLFAQ